MLSLAGVSHHFRRTPAGDPLRRLIPKDDSAIRIGDIGAVGQQVQQFRRIKFSQEG